MRTYRDRQLAGAALLADRLIVIRDPARLASAVLDELRPHMEAQLTARLRTVSVPRPRLAVEDERVMAACRAVGAAADQVAAQKHGSRADYVQAQRGLERAAGALKRLLDRRDAAAQLSIAEAAVGALAPKERLHEP